MVMSKINRNKLEKGDFESSIRFAIRNIVSFGDTDIFPFPLETRMLDDCENQILELFKGVHSNFSESLNSFPPLNVDCCSTVGYYGFRWATQVDPIWNVYFLGLVVSLAKKIEDQRLPSKYVYSYRIYLDVDRYSLYSEGINWRKFQFDSLELCEKMMPYHTLLFVISQIFILVFTIIALRMPWTGWTQEKIYLLR